MIGSTACGKGERRHYIGDSGRLVFLLFCSSSITFVVWLGLFLVYLVVCISFIRFCILFAELQELSGKVDNRLAKRSVKTYGNRNVLHRRMLSRHAAFPDFVTGSKIGVGIHFHCRVCKRDVAMSFQGSGEFSRHFRSDAH